MVPVVGVPIVNTNMVMVVNTYIVDQAQQEVVQGVYTVSTKDKTISILTS